ncbi:MAG: RadC family protein [Culicoidibacterales bacterium]
MVTKNKGLHHEIQPRERFFHCGVDGLSNQELMMVILETGTKAVNVSEVAQAVLETSLNLGSMQKLQFPELMQIPGIGKAKAIKLLAAIELGKRIHTYELVRTKRIRSPKDCAQMFLADLRFEQQEQFICLYLNTKNEIIHQKKIYIGGLNSIVIHPREVFQQAIRVAAASVICLHNHPSGDATPSQDDIKTTKRLIEVGELVGIEVLDHLVLGDNTFTSLKEKGYF